MKTKIITGCSDCPFLSENDMGVGYTCKAMMHIINELAKNESRMHTNEEYYSTQIKQNKKYQPITPNWCPIKKESLNITY